MKKIKHHRFCFLVLKIKEERYTFIVRKTYHTEVVINSMFLIL